MIIIEGPEVGNSFQFTLNENNFYKVGRKTENHLSLQNDQHLSNLHARFYIMEESVHIEDITSTNGFGFYLGLGVVCRKKARAAKNS
jgi:pSer/pThr/pTyr-binding forkhead associated (FHA) protein